MSRDYLLFRYNFQNGRCRMAKSLYETHGGNHGSCVHQNKYPVQDDEHNYQDSMRAHPIDGTGH